MSGVVRLRATSRVRRGLGPRGLLGDRKRCLVALRDLHDRERHSRGRRRRPLSPLLWRRRLLVVCGDAGDGLGDSLYEAVIYVRGEIKSLGATPRKNPMTDEITCPGGLLECAGFDDYRPEEFKRVASARKSTTGTPTRPGVLTDDG